MGIADDLRYAWRDLRRAPAFSLAAVCTLAVCMGANTAVFTVVKAVLLEPLPMRDPQRLVSLWTRRADGSQYPFNIPNFLDLRARTQVLEDAAAYGGWNANLTGEADPVRLFGVRATGNFFEMLGVRAAIGRALEPADDAPGAAKVVVITYGLWQRRYGGDRSVLGRTVLLNGTPHTLVGVLPASFSFVTPATEFAVPLAPATDPTRAVRESTSFLRAFGRLKPGVSPAGAQSDLDGAIAWLRAQFPEANSRFIGMQVKPLQEEITGGSRPMLTVLAGAVGFVLTIACANLSSLMMARAGRRRKDLAVKAALGGSPRRLARQLLIEGVVLAVAGGVAGMVLANWGVYLLLAMSPAGLPRAAEVRLDGAVLGCALGASLLCGVLFSLLPALQSATPDLARALRAESRGGTGSAAAGRIRGIIVAGEVALSVVLLSAAGLLLQSFARLTSNDPGFRADDVMTFRLSLPSTRYRTTAAVAGFHDRLYERIAATPQAASAGMISILPLSGPTGSADFTIAGDPPVSEKEKPSTEYRMIDWTYFQTMSIPLLRGRGFTEHDNASSRGVAIVSQALARRFWRGRDPVGSRILMEDRSGPPRDVEVVGLSGEVRELALDQPPTPCVFVPISQIPENLVRFATNNTFWAVRPRNGANVEAAVRRQIHEVDGDVAALVASMQSYVDKSAGTRRFSLRLLAAFALAALLLASSGLYAVVSYATAQRTREIGVRMALGARPTQVAGLVLRQGLALAALGVAVGVGCSWVAARYLSTLLFEVSPHDPATLAAAAVLMLAVALAAGYAPVRRAVRVDPLLALRSE